ncbi:MAG: winged helix DNA-binding domain-containing protein [Bacillota bacterium]|nr:winged helix DNA-binding domain-containing protein [Bacillota bacterium]
MHTSDAQALGFRLCRQRLACRSRESVEAVASATGGIQAQVTSASRLALWARIADLSPGAVDAALQDTRTLVKVWSMRGTAHLLRAGDLPYYVAALQRPMALHERRWLAERGLDADDCLRLFDEVDSLLDVPMTRQELGASIRATLGDQYAGLVEHSWGGMLKRACLEGRICFGPQRGQQVTFVRTRDWLGGFQPAPREASIDWLLERYLKGYAPATAGDFAYWSGLPVTAVRPSLERLADRVVAIDVAGVQSLVLREDVPDLLRQGTLDLLHEDVHDPLLDEMAPRSVNLLPNFDPYLLGHRDKRLLVDEHHYKKIFRVAGWVSQVVLVGGRVLGTWEAAPRQGCLRMTVALFDLPATGVIERIEEETQAMARFLGVDEAKVTCRR